MRLKSRNPGWLDNSGTYLTIKDRWKKEWSTKKPYNNELVEDPNLKLPGFNLPRRECSRLNRFRCGQGRSNHLMKKWKLTDSELCEADGMIQTMKHLVEECPTYHFSGGMKSLHILEGDAVRWLSELEKEV